MAGTRTSADSPNSDNQDMAAVTYAMSELADATEPPSQALSGSSVRVATERTPDPLLPPAWPEFASDAQPPRTAAEVAAKEPSIITRDQWIHDEEYWLAHSSRVPRPQTRPITPPRRFAHTSRSVSMLLMVLFVTLAVAVCIGALVVGQQSDHLFNQPHATPTLQATHTPVATTHP